MTLGIIIRRLAVGLSSFALCAFAWEPASAQSLELSLDVDVGLDSGFVEDHQVFALDAPAEDVGLVPANVEVDAYHHFADGGELYSTASAFELAAGGTAERGDVVRFDGNVEGIEFDASSHGLPDSIDTDAVAVDAGGQLLLSFDTGTNLSGLDVRDEDLVLFDGAIFSLFFDGSAQSVPETLDLDAAERRESDGVLLLSFDTAGEIDGVFFEDEDVLAFDPGSGSWTLELDASAEASALANADVDAIAMPEPSFALAFGAGGLALALLRVRRDPSHQESRSRATLA